MSVRSAHKGAHRGAPLLELLLVEIVLLHQFVKLAAGDAGSLSRAADPSLVGT